VIEILHLDASRTDFWPALEALLSQTPSEQAEITQAVTQILAEVRTRGDAALLEFTRRFDHHQPRQPAELEIGQARLWQALADIPFGETWTYAQLAARVGKPTAMRAVGAANGQNPLAIVVPCHRVIGAGGALTGYAGGLHRKRWLLAHEREVVARTAGFRLA
jgi:O-6-methylguanine DNA methyltransferase